MTWRIRRTHSPVIGFRGNVFRADIRKKGPLPSLVNWVSGWSQRSRQRWSSAVKHWHLEQIRLKSFPLLSSDDWKCVEPPSSLRVGTDHYKERLKADGCADTCCTLQRGFSQLHGTRSSHCHRAGSCRVRRRRLAALETFILSMHFWCRHISITLAMWSLSLFLSCTVCYLRPRRCRERKISFPLIYLLRHVRRGFIIRATSQIFTQQTEF